MKSILKYFTILFFIVIFLISIFIFVLFRNNDKNIVTEEDVHTFLNTDEILSNEQSAFSKLSDEEKASYLRISEEIENISSDFYLTGNNTNEEQFNRIYKAILQDHPEYFYVKSIEYAINNEGLVENVDINYTSNKATILKQQEDLENWKNEILSAITPEMTDYDIALYLHDYLVNNTDYNENVANNQNLISVVEEAESVCAGYARAYQYLLNETGIFATFIEGETDLGSHAWNLIQLNDEYGFVDVTWDDPSFIENTSDFNNLRHSYFGLGTEELKVTRTFDGEEITIPMPSFNYFTHNNLYFDLDDSSSYFRFIEQIRAAKNNEQDTIEIMVKDNSQIDKLLNRLSFDPILNEVKLSYVVDEKFPIINFIIE